MKYNKPLSKNFVILSGVIFFSFFNLAWISTTDYNFGNLKNKSYYNTLFTESELFKLAQSDDYYSKGHTKMLEAENYFRKADGFKKVAENYGGKTLKKVKSSEKKGVKKALKAFEDYFKASDIKFHVYSEKLKKMNTNNSKKQLKAEEISINARSIYIEGSELKAQAQKLNGKDKTEILKHAFKKHLEAIYNQELAFAVYMNDSDIIYNENKDEVVDLSKQNKQNLTNSETYNTNTDPNIYESKEEFIISKLKITKNDISTLTDAKDKKTYANTIMNEVDNDYIKIEKIRNEAEKSNDIYEKDMKIKMAEGMEEVLFEKMLKAADLYFNADKTKYEIYNKYLPEARSSNKISEAKPYEENARNLHSDALKRYHKANFYSGHKSNKYIQIMDAVQSELSAIQEQENAFNIYFNKTAEIIDIQKNTNRKTIDKNTSSELTYNYSGSFMYSKYNSKPIPLVAKKGIIFKVQVGLFKGLLPLKTYGKYSPISYDTFKNNPYRRFFIGEYRSYKAAEYVLNQIKRKGLTDPFIVAFENGEKKSATYGISKIIRDETFEKNETKEMSLLTGGVYRNNNQHISETNNIKVTVTEISDITKIQGLIYCVQLGNFSNPKKSSDFKEINNLLSDQSNGIYKYLSGPYESYEQAKNESNRLKEKGREGTFVTAYFNGKKVSLQEAKNLNNSKQTKKINSVDKDKIYFSVQIAAYSHRLNTAEMKVFNRLSDKYNITIKQVDGGLFLYMIGKYKTYQKASSVKKEIKTLNYDGFVIAFKNGIKINASEAVKILKTK